MALIAMIYLLLAMPVKARVFLCMHGLHGNALLEVELPGLRLCRNAPIPKRKPHPKKGRGAYLVRVIRACSVERFRVQVRLGTGDAAQTALASGALRAGLLGMLAARGIRNEAGVCVVPVFGEPCFSLAVEGIFSAALGDVMYAALMAALKKSGKEGFGWKSIPLRA